MKYLKTCMIMLLILAFVVSGAVFAQDDEPFTIGLFTISNQLGPVFDGFQAGMAELGYVEGENIRYLDYSPPEDIDQDGWTEAAQALIDAEVDLIFTPSDEDALVIKDLAGDIPLIFALASDPIGSGLVADLTEPGGNATGVEISGYHERRLQLLVEIDPSIKRVYYPYNPDAIAADAILAGLEAIAQELDIELLAVTTTNMEEGQEILANIPEDIDAIFLSPGSQQVMGILPMWIAKSLELQAGISAPAYMGMPGILMGYGPDPVKVGRQVAGITDRILHGAEPADLPVESADFFLAVNLATARMIDLEVPRSILRQAGIIIRPGDLEDFELPGDETKDDSKADE